MTQNPTHPHSTSPNAEPFVVHPQDSTQAQRLHALLFEAARRDRKTQRQARLVQGGWWWLSVLLVVLVYDALWPWQEVGRSVIAGLLVLLAVLLLVRAWVLPKVQTAANVGASVNPPGVWHAASALENHHGLHDNPMVNALWLADQHDAPKGSSGEASAEANWLAHALRERAIGRGVVAATRADTNGATDRRGFDFHRMRLLAAISLWVILALLMPRLLTDGMARLASPWGDHPPFSLTRFHVSLPDGPVLQGGDVTVEITLTGEQPATLDWVELAPAATFSGYKELRRWRLEPITPGVYRRRLGRLNEDITFQLEAGRSRSQRMTISVEPRPLVTDDEQAAGEDAQNPPPSGGERSAATSQPQTGGSSSQDSDHPAVQAGASAQQSLAQAADQLARAAQQLQEALQQNSPPDAPLTPQQQAMVDDIARQLQAFNEQAAAAQRQLESARENIASGKAPPASAEELAALDQMAQTLKELLTPQTQDPSSLEQANCESMGMCMSQLASAARKDHDALTQPSMSKGKSAGQSDHPSGEVTTGGDELAKDPSQDTDELRSGAYHQQDATAGIEAQPTTARGRGVPEIYRPMVQQYFSRINEDQKSPEGAKP